MFQAWNVGEITEEYFGVPSVFAGIALAVLVGMVIIGGIKRIGAVAGRLVPFMVTLYLLAGLFVLISHAEDIPSMLALIVRSAFVPQEMTGAFIGGTAGYAFLFGMKRALFSNEAGQGTSPIAHSAAKTDEPIREAMVAGLEPFIDTIVVCTFTALVILSTGVWNRAPEGQLNTLPAFTLVDADSWALETVPAPQRINNQWNEQDLVFIIVNADTNPQSGNDSHRLEGRVLERNGGLIIEWAMLESKLRPSINDAGVYATYVGATLTAKAFDSVIPGLGKWLITLAVWLFALSTMISWSYYGEQGVVFLFGDHMVLAYKFLYCALIIIATWGFIESDADLDNLTGVGTGVMLWANVPIMWLFVNQAMRSYHDYVDRLKTGKLNPKEVRKL